MIATMSTVPAPLDVFPALGHDAARSHPAPSKLR